MLPLYASSMTTRKVWERFCVMVGTYRKGYSPVRCFKKRKNAERKCAALSKRGRECYVEKRPHGLE